MCWTWCNHRYRLLHIVCFNSYRNYSFSNIDICLITICLFCISSDSCLTVLIITVRCYYTCVFINFGNLRIWWIELNCSDICSYILCSILCMNCSQVECHMMQCFITAWIKCYCFSCCNINLRRNIIISIFCSCSVAVRYSYLCQV